MSRVAQSCILHGLPPGWASPGKENPRMVLCGQENQGGNDRDPVGGHRKTAQLGASEDLVLTKGGRVRESWGSSRKAVSKSRFGVQTCSGGAWHERTQNFCAERCGLGCPLPWLPTHPAPVFVPRIARFWALRARPTDSKRE